MSNQKAWNFFRVLPGGTWSQFLFYLIPFGSNFQGKKRSGPEELRKVIISWPKLGKSGKKWNFYLKMNQKCQKKCQNWKIWTLFDVFSLNLNSNHQFGCHFRPLIKIVIFHKNFQLWDKICNYFLLWYVLRRKAWHIPLKR